MLAIFTAVGGSSHESGSLGQGGSSERCPGGWELSSSKAVKTEEGELFEGTKRPCKVCRWISSLG